MPKHIDIDKLCIAIETVAFPKVEEVKSPIKVGEEGREFLSVRGWTTSDLVSFGNYMLNRYVDKRNDAWAKNLSEEDITGVTDADLANWRETLS